METNVDFDALARKSNESGGAMDDLNNLFGATFALEKWLFIARGELPNVNPYVAANAEYAGGQQMIRAFTDSDRLQRFAKENNLTDVDGSAQMLTVPTVGIVEYLEQFINNGVHGVWFNSDTVSDGYFIPLAQLRPIKEHLAKINWQSVNQPTDPTLPHNSGIVPPVNSSKPPEDSAEIKTAVVMMQDGLMSSDNVFTPSSRTYFCFCRLPASWTDGERVKNLVSEKLFEIVYRHGWNTKKPPEGSRYIVPQPKSKVYSREEAGNLDWKTLHQQIVGDVLFLFYMADENGELREVTETKFRAEIDLSFQKSLQKLSGYKDWFRSGTIKFDTTFKPFFHELKPLLADYAGAGDYKFSFAGGLDEPGMKDLFEDVTSNAHGAYLKYRSCISERGGKTEDLQVIGSNLLTHTQTGEKLRVQLTLRKELAAKTAKLIIILLGPEAEVEKFNAAIQPALDESDFTVQLNSKNTPSPETAEELAR
ncbi:hypothetical protein BH10ACI1_BH10ACI1_15420 [soil metagenome]